MSKTILKSLNHCVYRTSYHLVLVTKYRHKAITPDMLDRLILLSRERVEAWGGELYEANGEPDHLHLLFDLPPRHAVSDFVNALKTGTSRRIRKEYAAHLETFYWKPVFWSKSYCVVSCGGGSLEAIKEYIENQSGA